jgi:hypothetical protein
MGVAGGRKLPLEEMRTGICDTFSAEGIFFKFDCCCIEIGVPIVRGITRASAVELAVADSAVSQRPGTAPEGQGNGVPQ